MNTTELNAALAAAAPGAVIEIPPGEYGNVILRRRREVKVVGRPDAVMNTFKVSGSHDVAVENLTVKTVHTAETPDFVNAFQVVDSEGVDIKGGYYSSGRSVAGVSPDAPPPAPGGKVIGWPAGRAMSLERSKRILVEGVTIRESGGGITMSKLDGLTIRLCDIGKLRRTPINGGYCSNVLIERNYLHESRPWNLGGRGDHADFIHLWCAVSGTTPPAPSNNIQIIDNWLDQAEGAPIMGIYLDDNGQKVGFRGVLVARNTLLSGHPQGILLDEVWGEAIDNTLIQLPGSWRNNDPRDTPSFKVVGGDVSIRGNSGGDAYGVLKALGAANTIFPGGPRSPEDIAAARAIASQRVYGLDPKDQTIRDLRQQLAQTRLDLETERVRAGGLEKTAAELLAKIEAGRAALA